MTPPDDKTSVERLLPGVRAGDKQDVDGLFVLAYDELRRLAHRLRRGEDPLTTTALVHEVYLKMMPGAIPANDRAHFKLLIARAMRQLLIDEARSRRTVKRGGDKNAISLDPSALPVPVPDMIDLEEALRELERADPRRAAVVECRFFGGLDVEETAVALGVSTATVKRDWRLARAWLAQALQS